MVSSRSDSTGQLQKDAFEAQLQVLSEQLNNKYSYDTP